MLYFAAPILALAASTVSPDRDYRVSVEIVEQNGDARAATSFEEPLALGAGEIAVGDDLGGAAPVLTGTVRIEGDRVVSDLTLCRPARATCEKIAQPRLTFALGEEGRFHVAGPDFSATLTLSPVAG